MTGHITFLWCPKPWTRPQRSPFPSFTSPHLYLQGKRRPKLDLLTSVDPSSVPKTSPRTRYESSTSSRLFPGAWFSSPRSPPDDTRTSMEEATGEFVLSKSSMAPNEPVVAEAPEDVPGSPITPASPTTKKDKKWRMCQIM